MQIRKKNKTNNGVMEMENNAAVIDVSYDEKVFVSGTNHFSALLQDIGLAKHSIALETYLFHNDHLGLRVAHALREAAKRGVAVRVMVDGAGSPFWTTNFARMLEEVGAQTKVFHPFPWQLWNWSRSVVKLPIVLKWIYLLLKANFRNHRKVCIIDHKIAYIGSLNISKCHLERQDGGDGWRDTSVRLEHIDLVELSNAFDAAWHHRTIKERLREAFKHVRLDPPIRLNYTRHRRRILYKNLLRRISNCQKRIWITNAYFVPDNFLLKRLKDAARNGVDVRILLPKKSDVLMMPWASSTFYYSLLRAGIRIFEYLPSMLHAKTLILDDWVLVGSSNLNHRSLLHDLEADITLHKKESKQSLMDRFLEDIHHSREISLDSWHIQRPLRQRMLGRLVLYIKYWI
ncbi:MAG: cardiolipin synthase B [Gammaproteobacteria bacterium RIFCSPHIGHO2_12_FULL_41_15]|nr:MAG: cardiolipin synthase B [Gammaproteobacteria bacterium RIFCSPHIGHO2_12_FULL_41_15]